MKLKLPLQESAAGSKGSCVIRSMRKLNIFSPTTFGEKLLQKTHYNFTTLQTFTSC